MDDFGQYENTWICPECGYSNMIDVDRCGRCRTENKTATNFINFEEDIQ